MPEAVASPFQPNQTLHVTFPSFSVSIVFHAGTRLTVTVLEGKNAGFTDTVEYEVTAVRDGIVLLSWRERIGSTIVHVMDLPNAQTHTFVTPAEGEFSRMLGKVRSAGLEDTGG